MPPFSIENRFGGSKPPPYEGGSICKELSRPIYLLDSINLNLTKEGIIYEKILVAFLFVLIGFYTPSFIDAFQLDGSVFELVMFAPYVGIPLAVWGMFEKK